jgi:hypothetical protein
MAVPASQYPPALHKTLSEANRQVPLLPTATLPAAGLHKRSVFCSAARGSDACYTPPMDEVRIIATLQDALTKHFWPECPARRPRVSVSYCPGSLSSSSVASLLTSVASLNPFSKDIPDVADYALWDWTNDYDGTGRLVAYKGGTTELFITIEGMPENTALPGAEKLAARALGPKTGFVYTAAAPPEKSCDRADFHNISGCLTAKQALTANQALGGLALLVDSQEKADLGGPAMVELVKARAEFWATYPNSDRHPQAVVRLRRALSAVDFTYLFTHFYSLNFGVPPDGHGQQRQNLYQVLLGTPPEENVIHESARKQFDAWISAVYNRLNGGLGDILNIQSRLPQALASIIFMKAIPSATTVLKGPRLIKAAPVVRTTRRSRATKTST